MYKRIIATFLIAAFFVLIPTTSSAHPDPDSDVVRAHLYRDGSIGCTGADDTSHGGGQVVLFPHPNAVHFKIKLKHAQPNTVYTVAVSEEPNCANAQFYNNAITTDNNGKAVFYGTYATTPGQKTLLIDLVAPGGTTNPINREIGTVNAVVTVP